MVLKVGMIRVGVIDASERAPRIVTEVDAVRHIAVGYHEQDQRIWFTACGEPVAMIGSRCPTTKGHLIALPNCPKHKLPTNCTKCSEIPFTNRTGEVD